jgi:site-specific DNA-adenine methylase
MIPLYRANNSRYKSAPSIPYKGNKQAIAWQITSLFPKCEHLLDACCGGGSIGLTAAARGICRHVTLNDIYKPVIMLLEALITGRHDIDFKNPPCYSRNDFNTAIERVKNDTYTPNDVMIMFCYSFGNNGKNYLYGKDTEQAKLLAQQVVCAPTWQQRRLLLRSFVLFLTKNKQRMGRPQSIESLENLKRLQELEGLERLERLERLEGDILFSNNNIFKIDYAPYDCIYFDIPYKGCASYFSEFNHAEFWDMFMALPMPAFASEYEAPDFVPLIEEFDKRILFSSANKTAHKTEKVFANQAALNQRNIIQNPQKANPINRIRSN